MSIFSTFNLSPELGKIYFKNISFISRNFSTDLPTLKEAQFCGQISQIGRKTYQNNTFNHGLITLKLSKIEEILQNTETAIELKKWAQSILINCIGYGQTSHLMNCFYFEHKWIISIFGFSDFLSYLFTCTSNFCYLHLMKITLSFK